MTTLVSELYDALKKAGIDEEHARAAARAVIAVEDKEQLATKADLNEFRLITKADLAEVKALIADSKVEMIKWNVGALAVLTAIFSAIVKLT